MYKGKLRIWGYIAVLLIVTGTTSAQAPLGTAFTFQGQLKDGSLPVDDDFDFIFHLYDANTGGNQIGSPVIINDWPVVDGLFTLQLDFGGGVFNNEARWIEIEVRAVDGGEYITLSPRQSVTAAPVALYALDGPGSSGHWAENGTAIYNTNSGRVGVGTMDMLFNLHVFDMVPGADIAPPTTFGVQWSQAVYPTPPNEWFYFAVGGAGPISGSGTRMIREAGTELHFQTQEGIYSGWPETQVVITADGWVGIGVDEPAASLDSYTTTTYPAVKGASAGTGVYGVHTNSTGTLPGVWGATESGAAEATGVRGIVNSTSPGHLSAGVRGHNNGVGVNGVGVYGSHNSGGYGVYGYSPDGYGICGYSPNGRGVFGSSSTGYAGYFDGMVRINGLEIVGADLAEKFPVSETTEPGMVVMIDVEHPGSLCLARGAYNRCVAGVISGAGNIPAGTILGNLPGSEGSPPVALSGRVWVNCDASSAPIEPGDLLTSSETPGFAMTVSDFSRAHGAVIGKAMTRLPHGETGLVLVLMNLQ